MEATVGDKTDIILVDDAQERVLVSILSFSAFLLEYCSNRSLYSSTKYLSSLLSCSSLAVLNATLSVCIQISQRYRDTRGGRAATAAIDIHKMLKIASLFAANIAPLANSDKISLVDFVADEKKWPDQLRTVSIEYFASKVREPVTAQSTPTKFKPAAVAAPSKTGLQTFTISSSEMKKLSVLEAYERATAVLPEDLHLDALMYIRAAKSFSTGAASRVPLVSAKCMAITFAVLLLTENVLATKFYAPYPNLVQHLVDLLNPDYKVPNELRSNAIEGLYAMARQRTKLHEILTCLSANVSHGLLMHIIRTLITDLKERRLDEKYASDFCELVVNLCMYASTGQMLVSAGLVPALLELIDNDSPYLHMKNMALTLLGQLTLSAPAAFTALINANGVDLIARLIKNEVDYDLENHGPVPTHCKVDYEISYSRAGWLKAILKFVLQVMPTGGNAERLRNLIDSSTLLSSLGAILQSSHVFGSTIVSVSLALIITVLHNEPTSYSIISEAGLIDIFFACADEILSLSSNEILVASLNAIGAICLNPDGLERASTEFDYSLIFKVLEDPKRSEELTRHDLAAELGAMVDELIRHNPKLLPSVMDAVDKTAASLATGVSHDCTDTAKTDAEDSERAFVIDNFGRFFDCLIANERVCEYFVKDNGFTNLLDIITLGDMPYDYGTSEAVNALNDGLKHLSQRDEEGLVEVYDRKFDGLLHNKDSEFYKFWKSEPGWDTTQIPKCSPSLLNQLTSVHSLLNSYEIVFDWAAQLKFVETKNPVEIFELIESLYARASWEIVRISNSVPEDWKKAARLHYFSIAFGPSRKLEEDKKKQIAEIEEKLPADSEYWDLKQYWFVLNGITMATLRCLSNVAKLISAKRLVDHTTNKKLALNIADWVAKGLINNFDYLGIILHSDLPLKARSGYCVYVIAALRETMLSQLRGGGSSLSNTASLRTSVFAPFRQAGGLEKLLEVLHYFWGQMEDGDTPEEAAEAKKLPRDEFESREFKKPATLTVNRILEFLLSLVTKECIVDSSFTLTLNTTGDEKPYFNGGQFLVENKLAVLTGIKPLLLDKETQRRAGARVFEWLLQLVSRLTLRLGEPASSDKNLIPTVLSPQFCTPSDYKVDFLVSELDFAIEDAKKKLVDAGDNLAKVVKAAGKTDVELPEVPHIDVWVPHDEDGTPLLTVAQLNTLRANLGNSLQERSLEFLETHADHANAVQELFSTPSDSLLDVLTKDLEKGIPGRYELIALSIQDDRNRDKFLKRGMYTLEWAQAYMEAHGDDFLSRSEFAHFLAVYERCYFVATEYPLEEPKHSYAEVSHNFTEYNNLVVSEEAIEYVFSRLLAIQSFSQSDTLLAVSRVMALYTTNFKYSDRIRGSPVLSAMLKGIKDFPDAAHMDSIQQTVLVLLRHCTETATSIQNIIAHKLGQSSRGPISSLMQQYSYLYARNPEFFIRTAQRTLTCDVKHFPEVKPKKVEPLTAEVDHCGIVELLTTEITSLGSSWVPEPSDDVEHPAEPKDYPELAYLTFLLNCLTELLGAYADSKLEFVSLGRKKHGLLSYFLTKLLYFSTASNELDNTTTRARMSVSASATSCLHALVSSTQERDFAADSTEKRDLVMVRKALLDTVMRLLREATHLDTLDKRYSRYAVLLDLCHKLLSAKTLSTATNHGTIAAEHAQQDSAELALVMYDKHFAKSVTALIADLDLNFPGAKKVAKTLLRPIHRLSHLTMENPDALDRGEDEDDSESEDEDSEDEDSEDETPQNIFQNSTLGMFEAEADSADEEMDEIGSETSELDDDDMEELEEPLYLDQEDDDSDLDLDGMSDDGHDSDHVAESDIDEVIAMEEGEDDWESYSEEELGEEELEDELDFSEAEPADDQDEGDAIGGVRDLIAALGNPSTPPPPPDYAIDLEDTDEEEMQESNSLFVPPPGHSGAVGGHPLLAGRGSGGGRSLSMSYTRGAMGITGINHPMDNLLERMMSRAVTGPDGGSFTIGIGSTNGVQIQRNVEALLTSVGGYRRPRKAGWDAKLLRFEASSTVIRWTVFARMFDIVKQRGVCWRAVAPIMNAIGPPVEAEMEARQQAQQEALQGRLAQEAVALESSEDEDMVSAASTDDLMVEEEEGEEEEEDEDVDDTEILGSGVEEAFLGLLDGADEEDVIEDDVSVGTEAEAEAGPARDPIYVTISGRQVDISGLDIDPTFLEALPEDMREEVVLQHIRESELDDSVISTLPDNMRAELRPVAFGQADSQDFATFLGTLDSNLRQTILMEQDEATLNALPDELVAEARRLRVRQAPLVMEQQDDDEDEEVATEDDTAMIDDAVTSTLGGVAASTPTRRHTKKVDVFAARNFVDKSGITALIRLLYLPQGSVSRDFLHELLLNVVRNRQARADVISILLSILQDGCRDRVSLERSFANLTSTSNVQGTPKSPIKAGLGSASSELSTDVTPMTVTLQVLDALSYLIRNNAHIRHYFLTEHEALVGHTRVKRKKALKSMKYPVNILFGLLKNPVVTERSHAMEVLSSMLQEATKPLQAKRRASMNVAAEAAALARQETRAAVAGSSDSAMVIDEPESEGITTTVRPKKSLKDLSPYIPSGNLSLVTQILTANECSSLTFQQTLSCMQNLLHIDNAIKVFSSQLSSQAIRLGKTLITDLVNLNSLIHTPGNALQGSALSKFSLASSDQAKLLRVLTAIDILFDKRGETKVDIYNSLTFGPLWGALSDVLSYVAEHPDLIHVATALLPLMEALMVVCKHSRVTERSALGNNNANSPTDHHPKYSARSYDFANEPIENLFFSFTDEHRKILNLMVRNNPKLMSGSFSILVKNPKVLEFDNKRNYFNRKIHSSNQSDGATINLNVRRDQVFLDSYKSMYFKSASEIRSGKLNIHFSGEEGVDAGGVTREWYQVLARQMFNPDYALFTPVASDSTTFHPNRTSWVNPEHLSFFKFIGRIIGKAIFDQRLLDCHFSRAVYKKILGRGVSLKDMETLDIEYHKSLVWMLENDITDIITETMSIETEDYGEKKTIDLMPDGRNIAVDESNKSEFVQRVVEYRLITSVEEQLEHFLQGFHDIIPKELVSIFNEQELELLICGLPEIDVDDWRNNTMYTNYSASSPQIQWFWRSIRSFDDEERAKLLQFVTGTSKVPLDGFKELEGMNGPTKFNIHRAYGNNERLPSSHTCFNQLDLPEYDSYETLRGSLLLAITEGREGFGFA